MKVQVPCQHGNVCPEKTHTRWVWRGRDWTNLLVLGKLAGLFAAMLALAALVAVASYAISAAIDGTPWDLTQCTPHPHAEIHVCESTGYRMSIGFVILLGFVLGGAGIVGATRALWPRRIDVEEHRHE